jgi:hypothetical protein
MKRRFLRLALMAGVLALFGTVLGPARAADEAKERAELAKALTGTKDYRVVSIVPQLKAGHPVADVTLLSGNAFKTVSDKLD